MVKSMERSAEKRDHPSDCKFKGVRKRKWGKWVSEIRLPNSRERIWLGSYDAPEKAARAYDAALFCLRGGAAKFNFPYNPPKIADRCSLTRSEIQEAAARFANSNDNCPRGDSGRPSSEIRVDSPSTSTSTTDVATSSMTMDSELTLEKSFFGMLPPTDSGNFASDFGLFLGFDDFSRDFSNGFFTEPLPATESGEENFDGFLTQGSSFLWNF